ncbi:tetratricopeptide repeat protein [Allostreptomyces psammosilenae]|uniref:Tetratricopeptide (TPR) repeat protein/DNA polymerase III delta prime subunit n=1 Tax=Allostreptomyces psammosilenae TaxID=1892865 RepID=A0A852ZYN1_9ACTN|nr:tetratricopeptide repeat protein [Allostreptomyces psammosilenae]NYI03392.1 tetratricopeptide (TPR) repeat protein/DNA polymerase III delta prime subunit [Allostreptomyces psammosilenae]
MEIPAEHPSPLFVPGLPAEPADFVGRLGELDALRADLPRPPAATARTRTAPHTSAPHTPARPTGEPPTGEPVGEAGEPGEAGTEGAADAGTAGGTPEEDASDGHCRVLVIAGAPGTGRTALALRLARVLREEYPDGRAYVRLVEPDGSAVPPRVAARRLAQQLPPARPSDDAPTGPSTPATGPSTPPVGTVPARQAVVPLGEEAARREIQRRTRGRRALLILDDVPNTDAVRALLPRETGCLVVAVTRGPLTGLRDTRPCVLSGLDRASALRLLTGLIGSTRVVCDPTAAQALVDRVRGVPTALRLAAHWLQAHPRASVADLLREIALAERGEGAAPGADAPAKPPAAGGRRPTATAAVPAPSLTDLVAALVEGPPEQGAGLPTPTGAGTASTGPASSGPASSGRAPAGRVPADPASPARPAAPPRAVRPSADSVREAAGALGVHDPLPACFLPQYRALSPSAARLLRRTTLAPYGLVCAHRGSALLGDSLDRTRAALGELVAAGLLVPHGDGTARHRVPGSLLHLVRERCAAEERAADLRLARARLLERSVRLAQACHLALLGAAPEPVARGVVRVRFRDRAEAVSWLHREVDALARTAADALADGELDTSAGRLAVVLIRLLGDEARARGADVVVESGDRLASLHTTVLEVSRRRRLPRQEAAALRHLGALHVAEGDDPRALRRFREALEVARTIEDDRVSGPLLEEIAAVHERAGELERAADWYRRALVPFQALRDPRGQARVLDRLADCCAAVGGHAEALRHRRAVVTLLRRRGDRRERAAAVLRLGLAQARVGRVEEALESLREAVALHREASDRAGEAVALRAAADVLERSGDPTGAAAQRAQADRLQDASH